MKQTLRFKIHALTPLRPLGGKGKYIGKNPFSKKKDDLIVDSHHDYIIIKSDSFAGTWSEFQRQYRMDLIKIKSTTKDNYRSIVNSPDLKIQKKLFALDSELEEQRMQIKKLQSKFNPILDGSKRQKYYFDTEFDVIFQFYVSKKHTAHNPKDDNIVYEDDVCKGDELIRKEKEYINFKKFHPKYQKNKWSAIINYLYDNCSDEDILCINRIFIEIKPMVQLAVEHV